MNGKSARLGLILALTLGMALSVRPASANPTLGMVVDNTNSSVTVFNADTDAVIGTVPLPAGTKGDCSIAVDKRVGYVTNLDNQVYQIDLTQTPPVLRAGVNPIAISNLGIDLTLSPRGEYLMACGDNGTFNTDPVSVILTQKRLEIGTFALNSDCNSVDVCQNTRSTNSTVLVSSSGDNNVRRLRLDSSGKLVDTGDVLAGGIPRNTNCAPQGLAGVALHDSPFEIQSFSIPGLAPVTTTTLTGGAQPLSGVFNPAGTIFYVRGATVVDFFSFDPTTGVLGAVPAPTIAIAGTGDGNTYEGMDEIARHPTLNKLYVTVPGAVNIYNATTGAPAVPATITIAGSGPTGLCLR